MKLIALGHRLLQSDGVCNLGVQNHVEKLTAVDDQQLQRGILSMFGLDEVDGSGSPTVAEQSDNVCNLDVQDLFTLRAPPAIAQLAEHLTVDCSSYQMVPGSIPGRRTLLLYPRRTPVEGDSHEQVQRANLFSLDVQTCPFCEHPRR